MAWWKKKQDESEHAYWTGPKLRLPEHREALLERREQHGRLPRPVLADDEIAAIQQAIAASLAERRQIALKLYDPYEELYAIGVVELIDIFGSSFRMNGDWFRVRDVTRAEQEW